MGALGGGGRGRHGAFAAPSARPGVAVVLVGCFVWALWAQSIHQQEVVPFLAPLVAIAAVVCWIGPQQVPPSPCQARSRGWDAASLRMDLSLLWVLSVISVGGVWLAVPETAVNIVIMMAVIPVAGVSLVDARTVLLGR